MDWIEKPLGENYVKDENLASLLKDKRIAYVGPAPQNVDTGYGEKIDSYDLVVRTGDILRGDDVTKDYGSRTDIIVHSYNDHDMNSFTEDDYYDMKNCKCLICGQTPGDLYEKTGDFLKSVGVPYHQISSEVFEGESGLRKFIASQGGEEKCLPNTGYNGILLMLMYEVKEIFMTGMTFYDMGKWVKSYHDNWYTEGGSSKKFKRYGLNETRDQHKQIPQIKHFQKIYEFHKDRIVLDKYLSDNLWSI